MFYFEKQSEDEREESRYIQTGQDWDHSPNITKRESCLVAQYRHSGFSHGTGPLSRWKMVAQSPRGLSP